MTSNVGLCCMIVLSVAVLPAPAAAQVPPAQKTPPQAPKPVPEKAPQQQPQQQTASAWFEAQLQPVNQGTVLWKYCAEVAEALHNRKPPPGYLDANAVADRAHNTAIAMNSPFHKNVAPKPIPAAHAEYRAFVAEGEARLKKCGNDLSTYTSRMYPHLQSIHDALEKSEGKITPAEGARVGGVLEGYDTQYERFVKDITEISNDPYLQGELHQAILYIMQQTAPPPHTKK